MRFGPPGKRRREAFLLVLLAALAVAVLTYLGVGRKAFTPRLPALLESGPSPRPRTARGLHPDAVLRREVGSLRGLVSAQARGELLAPGPHRALVVLDQALVEGLLRAQLPASHVVAERFRVVVSNAQVTFDDGLALVRIEGQVRLMDAPADVYADLVVFGDLHLAPRAPGEETLRLQVSVTEVEARHVDVGVKSGKVDRLIAEVGQAQVEAFAALAPAMDVPVRWEYPITIPGVGPSGPVRIEEATVAVALHLAEVRAVAGRLWLAVDLAVGERAPASPAATLNTSPLEAQEAIETLQAEHGRLHETLALHMKKNAAMAACLASGGDLTFVLPRGVLTLLAEEVAVRYLDRVALSLDDIRVQKEGEMHSNTAVGKVHSGSWRLQVELDRIRGVLRAGRPRVDLRTGGRIGLSVPVHIEAGQGRAALDFQWDSRGIANVVCRDFEVQETVEGAVAREDHLMEGVVTLSAKGDDLRLEPVFERRHRLNVVPGPAAWDKARAALERQDSLFRCGLAMKPDLVLAQLRGVIGRGFVIRLPKGLFRPIGLPSVLAHRLHVADQHVEVSAQESALHTTPERALLALKLKITLEGAAGAPDTVVTSPDRPHKH